MKTITINRFDKFFGQAGSSVGLILLIAGAGLAFVELPALILIPIGLFIGYTYSSTTIDFENRKVRFSNNLAGIFNFGRWVYVNSDMYININRNNKVYRTRSRGNRALDIKTNQFEIILYNDKNEKLMPLMYSKNIEDAQKAVKEIASRLELEIKN